MSGEICNHLMKFLDESHSMFHAIAYLARMLDDSGFIRLEEGKSWKLLPGEEYYTVRGASSLIAFAIPENRRGGFMMAAAHCDSPTYKLRQNAVSVSTDGLARLSVEKYGGAIERSWLDRPLSIAGRVLYEDSRKVSARLIDIDRDLLVIPSVAPHLSKALSKGGDLKAHVDMLPLFSQECSAGELNSVIAETIGIPAQQILATDLFLYARMPSTMIGLNHEFIASPRLDDLECAWCCLKALIEAQDSGAVPVMCVFNNEEVGSGTAQGADSTFLCDVLERLCSSFELSSEERHAAIAESYMVSADNAHAVHPAHPELSDANEQPQMNKGIVIKYNASQKYATDGFSAAVFISICKRAGVPVQSYSNRADLPGGSTLGHISIAHVSVPTVDIGLAQLAMHSCYEIAGAEDPAYLVAAMKEYFSSRLLRISDEITEIE